MHMKMKLPPFRCDDTMIPHVRKVFEGEYDLPLWGRSKTIIDAGANYGAFSVWAAHRWPGSHVYAYEPQARCFPDILWNVKDLPVECFNYGLGEPGARALFPGPFNTGEASLFGSGPSQTVEIRSPMKLPLAEIIKIDTEGAELEILEPLIRAGRDFEAILLEYHNWDNLRRINELLKDSYCALDKPLLAGPVGILRFLRKDLR